MGGDRAALPGRRAVTGDGVLPPVLDVAAMDPPVVVAGDVHLSPEHPGVAARFERFLEGLRGRCSTLVLLGDVFDTWVGRRQGRDRLAFVAGNRDYAFDGRDEGGALPVEVWPDVVRTTWGGRSVCLTHGDLLCTADAAYLGMRRFLRSAPARAGLAALPYRAATYLARGLRDLSNRETRRKPHASMGIDYGLARRWLEAADADVLVAGHVHTGVHHRLSGPRPRDVLVLKDWDAGGSVVRWDGRTIALAPPD